MTLKDIAELAGVSIATVSNVINGNFNKVSEETRQRVESIIQETGYKPNVIARTLAKNESGIIGIVVPYIAKDCDYMTNPYYANIIAALERCVRARGYYLMLRCVDKAREIIPLLSSWNVDGAIFLGVFHTEVREIQEGVNAPLVFLDTYAQNEKIVNVGIDDYRGGYLSARYLIGRGHRKIALVIPDFTPNGVMRERYRGFSDACRELSVQFTERDIFQTDTMYRNAMEVGQDIAFADAGYTAVAVMSDIAAFGVMEGLRQFGVKIPEDISVIGFDNLPECEYVMPKLTSIAQDFQQKAERAAQLLFQMIEGDREQEADERLPIRVKERQSVRDMG